MEPMQGSVTMPAPGEPALTSMDSLTPAFAEVSCLEKPTKNHTLKKPNAQREADMGCQDNMHPPPDKTQHLADW